MITEKSAMDTKGHSDAAAVAAEVTAWAVAKSTPIGNHIASISYECPWAMAIHSCITVSLLNATTMDTIYLCTLLTYALSAVIFITCPAGSMAGDN